MPADLKLFMGALTMAAEFHKAQRRWNGDPYIIHPLRVAQLICFDEHEDTDFAPVIVAVLHDAVEDADDREQAEYLVRSHFGDVINNAVMALTRSKDETYKNFIRRAKLNPLARRVKIADIKDNLRDLAKDHGLRKRYEKALAFLQED
jgi:(p)ppGpp synthase/HD superfamily hydrolase